MQPRACEPTYMVHHLGAGQTDKTLRNLILVRFYGALSLTHLHVMMIVVMMMFAVPGLVYY